MTRKMKATDWEKILLFMEIRTLIKKIKFKNSKNSSKLVKKKTKPLETWTKEYTKNVQMVNNQELTHVRFPGTFLG